MYLPFEEISGKARVWVYQSIEKLSATEKEIIAGDLKTYCERWAAHGNPLKASFTILNDHFLVITADEQFNQASGCSIDDSVHAVQSIYQKINRDFLNRTHVPFLMDEEVRFFKTTELKNRFEEGKIKGSDLAINVLAATKEEIDTKWTIPVKNYWLSKYLPKTTLAT
ncbi:MAG: hypothetical protein HC811_11795 [Flammeovirgaceae bacterium]|nr:hypothetical protein [Flammeovirgaceae bacterium]